MAINHKLIYASNQGQVSHVCFPSSRLFVRLYQGIGFSLDEVICNTYNIPNLSHRSCPKARSFIGQRDIDYSFKRAIDYSFKRAIYNDRLSVVACLFPLITCTALTSGRKLALRYGYTDIYQLLEIKDKSGIL